MRTQANKNAEVTPNTAVSAPGAAVTITLAATPGQRHTLTGIQWSYSAAPATGFITVQDGVVTILQIDITGAGPGFLPFYEVQGVGSGAGIVGGEGNAVTIELGAGGGIIVGKINAQSK